MLYVKSFAHLHPEEGDAGEQVHGGLEILQAVLTAGWEVILEERRRGRRGRTEVRRRRGKRMRQRGEEDELDRRY